MADFLLAAGMDRLYFTFLFTDYLTNDISLDRLSVLLFSLWACASTTTSSTRRSSSAATPARITNHCLPKTSSPLISMETKKAGPASFTEMPLMEKSSADWPNSIFPLYFFVHVSSEFFFSSPCARILFFLELSKTSIVDECSCTSDLSDILLNIFMVLYDHE